MIANRLIVSRLAGGLLVAHLGGLLLLALAVAVEAPPGGLAASVRVRVPSAWALIGSVLTVLGAALAAFRLRNSGVVLGLGTLGVGPGRVFVLALLLGALFGAGVGAVEAPAASELGWARVRGGWLRAGEALPDVVGEPVVAPTMAARRVVPPEVALGTGAIAGVTGVVLGLAGGPLGPIVLSGTALVAEAVCAGLVERGALPPYARFVPAVLMASVALLAWMRAPLFPLRR